jgi:hypothetical protein
MCGLDQLTGRPGRLDRIKGKSRNGERSQTHPQNKHIPVSQLGVEVCRLAVPAKRPQRK